MVVLIFLSTQGVHLVGRLVLFVVSLSISRCPGHRYGQCKDSFKLWEKTCAIWFRTFWLLHFAKALLNCSGHSYLPTASSFSFLSLLITLSRLSICLAQKNVDFLDFFAARNGPMIVFWPMKSKRKLLGEILLFSFKSQHVRLALFLSLSCLEYGHRVWKFSISLVMMRTGATFGEFWKLWLLWASVLTLNSLLNNFLLCEKNKHHTV